MKIYVAGKMCGLPGFGFEGFDKARDILVQAGHEVISPADIDRKKYPNHNFSSGEPPEGFDYTETLLHDLRIISECDAVYALYNWNDSKGAKAEVYFAKAIGKKILYETHLVRSSRMMLDITTE